MSNNLIKLKIATPYARALFDFSIHQNLKNQIKKDLKNLKNLVKKNQKLSNYLNNPTITKQNKIEILTKILYFNITKKTFQFLLLLINRNRINLLELIIDHYLKLIDQTESIKKIHIITADKFTNSQKNLLIKKLKKLTKATNIQLTIIIDKKLIGGFLIKNQSQIIDFSIKNKLNKLTKYLNINFEI